MTAEWLRIDAVAHRLGVSPRVARRWIREGKVHAELRLAQGGLEYHLPEGQIETAVELRDALHDPEHGTTPGEALDGYLTSHDGNVVRLLEDLRERLATAAEEQVSLEVRLREVRELQDQLAAGLRALERATVSESELPPRPRRRWWPFGSSVGRAQTDGPGAS